MPRRLGIEPSPNILPVIVSNVDLGIEFIIGKIDKLKLEVNEFSFPCTCLPIGRMALGINYN